MAAKLSKKELKEPDIFQTGMEKLANYFSENKTRLYVIAAAIVLALVIALGIYAYWSHYQASATELYDKAQNILIKQPENPQSAREGLDILKKIIDNYPHSWSAKMARYQLGNLYYNLGEIDLAIASYKKYLESTSADKAGIKFLTLTSLGYCYEIKKDYKSALRYFEDAQKANNTGFESIGYRNIARIYEQMNEKNKALDFYKKALEKTSDPSISVIIKRKINTLN